MGFLGRLFRASPRAEAPAPVPEQRAAAMHPATGELASLLGLSNTIPRIAVTPANALRCPAVSAPVRLISGALSIMPLEVFVRTDDGGRERDTASPLYDLLHAKPNDRQTSAQFRKLLTEWMLTWGAGYARVINPEMPTALVPLHPRRTWPFLDSAGRLWYRHTTRTGAQLTLSADEVLHLRYGHAKDDDEGLETESPIDTNRELIAVAMAAAEYLARFFANSATPRGVLQATGAMTPEVAKQTRADWEARYAGLENAHRVAVLPNGIQYQAIGMTHADAQILELYRQVSSDIAHKVYGLPPHLTGDTEKSSSWGTGIEQMGIGLVQHVIHPITEEWEQALEIRLLSAAGRRRSFLEMNLDGLMRGDFKTRMDGYALMIQWGLATPNEVRRMMNLPPMTGGDSRLQPLNMVPAERIMDILLRDPAKAQRALALAMGGGGGADVVPFDRAAS